MYAPHALLPLIADLRREELIRDAELERRARLSAAGQEPGRASWRRVAGRLAHAASDALGSAAHRLDPGLHSRSRAHLHRAH